MKEYIPPSLASLILMNYLILASAKGEDSSFFYVRGLLP